MQFKQIQKGVRVGIHAAAFCLYKTMQKQRNTTSYRVLQKSFTTLKANIHLFRGHAECFELS
jgi:hypothetical protein